MKHLSVVTSALVAALILPGPTAVAAEDQSARIVAVVQQFLDAMAARDQASALQVVIPAGRFSSVREEAGRPVIRSFNNQEDIATWAQRPESWLERIWNPEVRTYGRMAVVTAPYDFHRNGRFSHCGVDVFELLETPDGWRIAGGVYTVQREGCPPSPLGPPAPQGQPKADP